MKAFAPTKLDNERGVLRIELDGDDIEALDEIATALRQFAGIQEAMGLTWPTPALWIREPRRSERTQELVAWAEEISASWDPLKWDDSDDDVVVFEEAS